VELQLLLTPSFYLGDMHIPFYHGFHLDVDNVRHINVILTKQENLHGCLGAVAKNKSRLPTFSLQLLINVSVEL